MQKARAAMKTDRILKSVINFLGSNFDIVFSGLGSENPRSDFDGSANHS